MVPLTSGTCIAAVEMARATVGRGTAGRGAATATRPLKCRRRRCEGEAILGEAPPARDRSGYGRSHSRVRAPVVAGMRIGRGRTSGEVVNEFEMPTPDMLDDMGPLALNQRLDQLEAGASRDAELLGAAGWSDTSNGTVRKRCKSTEAGGDVLQVDRASNGRVPPQPGSRGLRRAPTMAPRRIMDRIALGRLDVGKRNCYDGLAQKDRPWSLPRPTWDDE